MDHPVALRQRPFDWLLVAFFVLNLLVITYLFDIEQVVVADPGHFQYPIWPPAFMVDAGHWWGRSFDPLLLARPVWWKATIWIDLLFFGPFYAFAIYAFIRAKEWIRVPAIIWAAVMMTNVTIILSEEIWGPHATPALGAVIGANASWLIFPILMLIRVSPTRRLFPSPGGSAATSGGTRR
jgi:hypothetical protein